MTTIKRQHTSPILIESFEDSLARPLFHVPLQSHGINESRLQELLAQYPNLIPIDEIEPAKGPLINIGREVPTPAGPIDLLFISPTGYLTVVETKLWRNPEARRSVVGQITDYAKRWLSGPMKIWIRQFVTHSCPKSIVVMASSIS